MKITYETLLKFAQQQSSPVGIADNPNALHIQNGELVGWDLAEKAERFRFEGRWRGRAEFERLINERMNPKPSNAMFIPMGDIEHIKE
jgi:hypothetical protein